ncbi:unnamed protein product [Phytomonas sp. EM1]|nr:unnamed protein product [Phytomonas sp. EM1]|eukprot:CCW64422.1 unnamed protein product [Phytomonas sp. isolate EM1]
MTLEGQLPHEVLKHIHKTLASEYVSAPLEVFLASFKYIQNFSFQKYKITEENRRTSVPLLPCVAPFLDLIINKQREGNVLIQPSTADEVRQELSSHRLLGARQGLRGKDAKYPYIKISCARCIDEGELIVLNPVSTTAL